LDLDAVCAFISSDLAPGERVLVKGPAGYYIGEGNCMYMLKCINGHVQAPRQYYMLCHEVYQKADLKQFHTDAEKSVVKDAEDLWLQMQKSKDLWLQIQKSKEANREIDASV